MSSTLTCTVMIATRNRRDDLARTFGVLRTLRPAPDEVLICADGCTDGTEEFVRREVPDFQLIVNATSLGSTRSRDHLMRIARAATSCSASTTTAIRSKPTRSRASAKFSRLIRASPSRHFRSAPMNIPRH